MTHRERPVPGRERGRLAVLDAYVGMTSPRAYRPPIPPEVALEELEHAAGKQFDPQVVDIFVRLVRANL